LVVDVRDYDGLRDAYIGFTEGSESELRFLINCAGINVPTALTTSAVADWDAVIGTNLTGTFFSCKAAAALLAVGGVVVNVSSTQAHLGGRSTQYAASKAGVEGMSRSMARELASRKIRVNCVAPGASETAMAACWDESTRARLAEQTLVGRISKSTEIADAILFLLSGAATYITGSVLHVNGGAYLN
jgi:3-oxoacyl-[acyl-carrier protein] reductase